MMKERLIRAFATAFLLLIATTAMALLVDDGRVVLLGTFVAFVALVISLDLMVGQTAMLALGHAAFFGTGAYVSTILNQELGWSILVSGPVAIFVVLVLALIVGYPAVSRTTGLFFAMITFAFGELLIHVVNRNTSLTGGSEGLAVNWGLGASLPFEWNIYRFFTVLLCLALFVTLMVNALVRHSHFGLRLGAVRESAELTSGLGFNPKRYRLSIFLTGSSLAGMTGVVYAPMVGFINPHLMSVEQSIYFLGLLFVGGTNSVLGAFLGVFLLSTMPQLLEMDPITRPIVVGLAMISIVLLAPKSGLAGLLRNGAHRLRKAAGSRAKDGTSSRTNGPPPGSGPELDVSTTSEVGGARR